jgi:hypothetical protein
MLVPDSMYVTMGSIRMLNIIAVRIDLDEATRRACEAVSEKLHHAVWTFTSEPAEVQTLGLMHYCPTCVAGVDQALAHLRDHPGSEVAVGQLWWAD